MTTPYLHPYAWGALTGQCGEWAVVDCEYGLHDVIRCEFLRRIDRVHITGTYVQCCAYVVEDMRSPHGTLARYVASVEGAA